MIDTSIVLDEEITDLGFDDGVRVFPDKYGKWNGNKKGVGRKKRQRTGLLPLWIDAPLWSPFRLVLCGSRGSVSCTVVRTIRKAPACIHFHPLLLVATSFPILP